MQASRVWMAALLAAALARNSLAADLSGAAKVGDRLAAYTPAKNLNPRGKLRCETC